MSSIDHHKQNAKRGSSALAHTGVAIPELYPHRKVRHSHGEVLNYPISSQTVLHKATTHTIYPSTSATDNALASGGFVDVRIPAGSLQVVKGMTIALEIENNTGGTTFIPAGPLNVLLFDRVELMAEGGNTQVCRWEPGHLLWPMRHLNGTSWDKNYMRAFITSGILNGVAVETYIPLLNEVFSRNEVFLGHLRSDMYLRIWFKGPSALNGGLPPTLKSLNLIVQQDHYAPEDRWRLQERASSQSLDYRQQRPGFQSIVETLGPSQRYSFMLTAIQGVVSELVVTIRPANSFAQNAYAFKPWHSYELLDSTGASMLGGMPIGYKYQTSIVDGERQNSGAVEAVSPGSYPIFIEFGDSRADLMTGSITGYVPFSGSERLVITTEGSLEPGSYEVRIEYLSVCRVNINQGRISVFPS
jgi:hypothetical protein